MKLTRFQLTPAVLAEMASDGNPAVRRAADLLKPMVDRHGRGDYDRAPDLQSIDDANGSLPLSYRYELLYHD